MDLLPWFNWDRMELTLPSHLSRMFPLQVFSLLWCGSIHGRGIKPLLSPQILKAQLPIPSQIRLMSILAADLIS